MLMPTMLGLTLYLNSLAVLPLEMERHDVSGRQRPLIISVVSSRSLTQIIVTTGPKICSFAIVQLTIVADWPFPGRRGPVTYYRPAVEPPLYIDSSWRISQA